MKTAMARRRAWCVVTVWIPSPVHSWESQGPFQSASRMGLIEEMQTDATRYSPKVGAITPVKY
jgi:hypothetical protein